jgi:peptide-methionine (S)-S-oxide reductase|tara:strand:+ start:4008 stop:4544 length:537 start_codon:yes stop_codon:yes gene_type:complete
MIKNSIFGGGCFWCTEAIFKKINGVISISPGYIGGHIINPTYEQICTGTTGHAEVIKIEYDSSLISFKDLLVVFFSTHDPTTLNRQGNDVGTQYRSSIFTENKNEIQIIESYISEINLKRTFDNNIVTTIEDDSVFYLAENYHHDYFNLNSNAPYCSFVIAPKVKKLLDSKSSFIKKN